MELKMTEEEVENMAMEYKALVKAETRLVELKVNPAENHGDAPTITEMNHNETPMMDQAQVLSTLESLQVRLVALGPKMVRFQTRLGEKDPVTDAPRYGEKTANRVRALLETYHALKQATTCAFECDEGASNTSVVQDLRNIVQQQEEAARIEALRKLDENEKRILQDKKKAEQALQEEEQQRRQAEMARAQQEAELAQRAQTARAAREEAEQQALQQQEQRRMEQERMDREWMDSITKGPEGVKEQLHVLKEATASAESSSACYLTAVTALHTLFSQIVAHPEQDQFRRVRRNHPKFHQDIGRHDGGVQVLIAAGFRLGAIDNVPCFISTEPNIETQMDEWTEWFDLLKATLEILQEELIKCT